MYMPPSLFVVSCTLVLYRALMAQYNKVLVTSGRMSFTLSNRNLGKNSATGLAGTHPIILTRKGVGMLLKNSIARLTPPGARLVGLLRNLAKNMGSVSHALSYS